MVFQAPFADPEGSTVRWKKRDLTVRVRGRRPTAKQGRGRAAPPPPPPRQSGTPPRHCSGSGSIDGATLPDQLSGGQQPAGGDRPDFL